MSEHVKTTDPEEVNTFDDFMEGSSVDSDEHFEARVRSGIEEPELKDYEETNVSIVSFLDPETYNVEGWIFERATGDFIGVFDEEEQEEFLEPVA